MLGALAQVLIADGDLGAGVRDAGARCMHDIHSLLDPAKHLFEGDGSGGAGGNGADVERDVAVAFDVGHQGAQLSALAGGLGHPNGDQNFKASLRDDIAGMDHDLEEIGRRRAIHANARRLQPVEHHMVDSNSSGAREDDAPIKVGQQQGQGEEHAEVELQRAAAQLDMQGHHAHRRYRHHHARRRRVARQAEGRAADGEQQAATQSQANLAIFHADCHRHHGAEQHRDHQDGVGRPGGRVVGVSGLGLIRVSHGGSNHSLTVLRG